MSNRELILEILDEIYPERICDDCITEQLKIKQRQQVNKICTLLKAQNSIGRKITQCYLCKKTKLANSKLITNLECVETDKKTNNDKQIQSLDIKIIHKNIVDKCKRIWNEKYNTKPPYSPSLIINRLRDDGFIPNHQANMMLTINGLRNCAEHDFLDLGATELDVASNAWRIIEDWWKSPNTPS